MKGDREEAALLSIPDFRFSYSFSLDRLGAPATTMSAESTTTRSIVSPAWWKMGRSTRSRRR